MLLGAANSIEEAKNFDENLMPPMQVRRGFASYKLRYLFLRLFCELAWHQS